MANIVVCRKASGRSENRISMGEIASSFAGNLTQTINDLRHRTVYTGLAFQ